jgi:starch synthase
MNKLCVLHITSEIYPFSKTGGLGYAVSDLVNNQADMHLNVTVFAPYYGSVAKYLKNKNYETVLLDIPIKLDRSTTLTCSCIKYQTTTAHNNTITYYFINHFDFFGRYTRNLYIHKDTPRRFYFFTRAVLECIKILELHCEIIHCHDWMTGLTPQLINDCGIINKHKVPKTILTIHNLAFQGSDFININRLNPALQKPPVIYFPEFWNNQKWEKINFLKQGIKYADAITTVSPTYAKEILSKTNGEGLSNYLSRRKPIYGIINGINYSIYNPLTSERIFDQYSTLNAITGKRKNKEKLLKKLLFPENFISRPIFFTNHRLSHQKGFDLILKSIEALLKQKIILIVAGEGDKKYHEKFNELQNKYKNFRFITPITEVFEERLMAAGDILLCPSVFEPCGTAHMKAMRYGVLPVARNTGGLADTIFDYDKAKSSGTGFLFNTNSSSHFLAAIKTALNIYLNDKTRWDNLILKCMNQSFDWEKSTQEYTLIYKNLLQKKTIK